MRRLRLFRSGAYATGNVFSARTVSSRLMSFRALHRHVRLVVQQVGFLDGSGGTGLDLVQCALRIDVLHDGRVELDAVLEAFGRNGRHERRGLFGVVGEGVGHHDGRRAAVVLRHCAVVDGDCVLRLLRRLLLLFVGRLGSRLAAALIGGRLVFRPARRAAEQGQAACEGKRRRRYRNACFHGVPPCIARPQPPVCTTLPMLEKRPRKNISCQLSSCKRQEQEEGLASPKKEAESPRNPPCRDRGRFGRAGPARRCAAGPRR